jgi:regulator of protease activity HflC (stomatin/prohibitin superfamily)
MNWQFCRLIPPLSNSGSVIGFTTFILGGLEVEEIIEFIIIAALMFAVALVVTKFFKTITIFEYERGVKFHNGKFREILGPGKYYYFTASTRIEVFDIRPAILQLNGQELLSADQITVKISLAVKYQITNPQALISDYQDYQEYLYTNTQFILREVISSIEMDKLLESRKTISENIKTYLVEDKSVAGLSILSVNLKDFMLSAELKKAYLEVIKAKKEALSLLEKARGEAATLRSLANTAKMLENNPELAKLRLIQTIETSKGNTFMIDFSNNNVKKTSNE